MRKFEEKLPVGGYPERAGGLEVPGGLPTDVKDI
jgi:hypothetical protein